MSRHKLLPVIKISAHTKRTEPENPGSTLANFQIKAATTGSIKIVAHVDKVHSTSAKNNLSLPDFCCPDVLVTWQQPAPEAEKSRWVNNGCK